MTPEQLKASTEDRSALEDYNGKRMTFVAYFDRFGNQLENGQTVLVQSVTLGGKFVCTHAWLQGADNFLPLDARKGERVQFDAYVGQYKKWLPQVGPEGTNHRMEYGLYTPTAIKLIERADTEPKPVVTQAPPMAIAMIAAEAKPARNKLAILNEL